jgi:hypothetical protein
MCRFLQNQGFDESEANFITNYAQEFKMLDVLELKDLETKIPSEALPRFWSGLHSILKKKLRMLIAWAKEECRIRSASGESTRWDGDARVNIEEFGRQWRAENINSEWRNLIMNQYAV